MFPVRKHLYAVRKLLCAVRELLYAVRKHNFPFEVGRFFSWCENIFNLERQASFSIFCKNLKKIPPVLPLLCYTKVANRYRKC